MRFAAIKKNDIANAPGIAVSVYVQGCPHHCSGCFNPETWDFNGGQEFTSDTLNEIVSALSANNVKRSLCILGGEPLCSENLFLTALIIRQVRGKYPKVPIYIWTGYTYDDVLNNDKSSSHLQYILGEVNYIIDGPFIESQKDLTLHMRGSRNQNIIEVNKIEVD